MKTFYKLIFIKNFNFRASPSFFYLIYVDNCVNLSAPFYFTRKQLIGK